jgi:transposase InsO family protein
VVPFGLEPVRNWRTNTERIASSLVLTRSLVNTSGRKRTLDQLGIVRRTFYRWYSRYIIAWKLCSTMWAEDVTDTLDMALAVSGCDRVHVRHKPRLLSDNGPSYIAGELAEYIEAQRMSHVRDAPFHPQTQGKIERWHQTLKNRILLENYHLPGDRGYRSGPAPELESGLDKGHEAGPVDSVSQACLGRQYGPGCCWAIIQGRVRTLRDMTPSQLDGSS